VDKLATRLTTKLPLILAGPILRRVTDSSVTVWVALQKAANVTLQIKSATGANVGNPATAPTIAVGRFLHSLPSFALPPPNLNELRIIHGSCRMPHANGPDALSILDSLIAPTAQNAAERPHRLLLTGDQIYADDVAAVLLMQLMDASNTLLGTDTAPGGWQAEELRPGNLKPSSYPALSRSIILADAGFTSVDRRSHLMSLGEYLCMYLFTWSDVLWPAVAALPTAAEVTAAAQAAFSGWLPSGAIKRLKALADFKKDSSDVPGDLADVKVHLQTLPKVRRALANIPTYMIFGPPLRSRAPTPPPGLAGRCSPRPTSPPRPASPPAGQRPSWSSRPARPRPRSRASRWKRCACCATRRPTSPGRSST